MILSSLLFLFVLIVPLYLAVDPNKRSLSDEHFAVGIILFFIPLFVGGLKLRKEPPPAGPFRRPKWGTAFFVIALLVRGMSVSNSSFSLIWYFGSLNLPVGGSPTLVTLNDWISTFSTYPLDRQQRVAINMLVSFVSIVILYALARKSRKILRYLSLSLLLPLLGNLLITLAPNPSYFLNPSVFLSPGFWSFWFAYSFTGTSYALSTRFGDFLMAASAIIFFRASRKVTVQAPPPQLPITSVQFVKCPNCGRQVSSTFSKCPHCNTALPK